jgi:hypothetical protein
VAYVIRLLIEVEHVVSDKSSVQARLVVLDASGDFADGVIALTAADLVARFLHPSTTKRLAFSKRPAEPIYCYPRIDVRASVRFRINNCTQIDQIGFDLQESAFDAGQQHYPETENHRHAKTGAAQALQGDPCQ